MVAKTRITAPIYYHLVYQVLTATIKPLPKKVPHACVQYIIMAMGMPKRFIINFFCLRVYLRLMIRMKLSNRTPK